MKGYTQVAAEQIEMLDKLAESKKREQELRYQQELSLENMYNSSGRLSLTTPRPSVSLPLPRNSIIGKSPKPSHVSNNSSLIMPANLVLSLSKPTISADSIIESPTNDFNFNSLAFSSSFNVEISDSNLCDHCSEKSIEIICVDCKVKTRLCSSCFALLHKAPSKKSHQFELFNNKLERPDNNEICGNCEEFPALVNCTDCNKLYCVYIFEFILYIILFQLLREANA